MKRFSLAAALWMTTALTPSPARAAEVIAFAQGFATFVGAGTIGSTIAATVGGGFAAGFATAQFLTASFVGRILVSVGLSLIATALMRPSQPPPQEMMVNYAQPIVYAMTVYGRMRTGGPLGFTGFASGDDAVMGEGGAKRHYSPVLAMHQIEGVVEHWLADKLVEVDLDGIVTTEPFEGDHYRIRRFLGGPAQTADVELMAQFPEITADHNFKGLGGAHIWCKRPADDRISEVLDGGRQAAWAPVIDGKLIYDPRTDAVAHSRNAALIIADWLVNTWGQDVDWDEVAVEADACDLPITIRGGATRPCWQIDTVLSDDQDFETQRGILAACCDAWFYERPEGGVGFRVGRWIEPDITLTDRDFWTLEKTTGQSGSGAINLLSVKYTEPNNQWKESPTADVVFDPEGDDDREDPAIYGITEHNQAWRMARRLMAVKRPPSTWRGTIGLIGHWLTKRRFWRIEHSVLGSVYVELQRLERHENGMAYDFEAYEVAPGDFDPEVGDIEPERPVYKVVASDDAVPELKGFTGKAISDSVLVFSWTDSGDGSLTERIRIREDGDPDWTFVDVPSGQPNMPIPGLLTGTSYEAQAVHRTATGRQSATWQPVTPLVLIPAAGTTPPGALSGFAATDVGADALVSWTSPAGAEYFATRIYRGPTTTFADAELVHTEYGPASTADSWTDAAPGVGTYRYWAEAINQSGIPGSRSGPETVTI